MFSGGIEDLHVAQTQISVLVHLIRYESQNLEPDITVVALTNKLIK